MFRRLLAASTILLAACSAGVAGLDPAPSPDSFEGGPWGVQFSLDLDAGFWVEGAHRYQIWLECPPLGPRQWSQHNFESDTTSAVLADEIFVRFRGLSLTETGPTGIKLINEGQPTTALVTVIGLEEGVARSAAAECVAELRLDDGRVLELPPSEPFRV